MTNIHGNGEDNNKINGEEIVKSLKTVYQMEVLAKEAEERLKAVAASTLLQRNRVMLSAAWMLDADYRQFLRNPEVLFIDATHKSNNEGRPLLLICGRDCEGNAFVIIQIFLPNETAGIYRWVFLDVLPSMLGKKHLQRVQLVLTDGDSAEYNALDESILKENLGNAIRGRCGHHLIKKSLQKHGLCLCKTRSQ